MNKAWILLILVVVLAAQYTFIASIKTVHTYENNAFGTSAVIVSKAPYLYLRAHIHVLPKYFMNSTVSLVFPNGTKIDVNSTYTFEIFLPKTDKNMGIGTIITPGEGVFITLDQPVYAKVVTNVTDNFFSYGTGTQYSNRIDIYWFKVIGKASVDISGLGVGI
jgi:hypothetical protein